MTRNQSGPPSTQFTTDTTVRPPPTVAVCALFALFTVTLVLAASFPVPALAAVGGAVLAKLHRRRLTARLRAATGSAEFAREATGDA